MTGGEACTLDFLCLVRGAVLCWGSVRSSPELPGERAVIGVPAGAGDAGDWIVGVFEKLAGPVDASFHQELLRGNVVNV